MSEVDSEWGRWDDLDLDDDLPRTGGRIAGILAIAVLVAALVGFAPQWIRALSRSSSATSAPAGAPPAAPPAAPSGAASPTTTPATEAPGSTTAPDSPTTTGSTIAARSTTARGSTTVTGATVPNSTTAPAAIAPTKDTPSARGGVRGKPAVAVSKLQIVPALRGVVIDIDGQRFVSDAAGVIRVPATRQRGVATVVGIADQPSLRRVGFLQWADGDRQTVRSLESLSGPTAEIGFTLSYRVTVQVPGDGPATVRFVSEAGPVSLDSGTVQWVPAAQAVAGPEGLSTQDFSYAVSEYERGGTVMKVTTQTFLSSPEALWRVG